MRAHESHRRPPEHRVLSATLTPSKPSVHTWLFCDFMVFPGLGFDGAVEKGYTEAGLRNTRTRWVVIYPATYPKCTQCQEKWGKWGKIGGNGGKWGEMRGKWEERWGNRVLWG